jgi:hypothetical protein
LTRKASATVGTCYRFSHEGGWHAEPFPEFVSSADESFSIANIYKFCQISFARLECRAGKVFLEQLVSQPHPIRVDDIAFA